MGSFHHYGEGGPFSRKGPHLTGEIGPPGPHITGRMGPGGPILPLIWGPGGPNLGGPHSTVTPVDKSAFADILCDAAYYILCSVYNVVEV